MDEAAGADAEAEPEAVRTGDVAVFVWTAERVDRDAAVLGADLPGVRSSAGCELGNGFDGAVGTDGEYRVHDEHQVCWKAEVGIVLAVLYVAILHFAGDLCLQRVSSRMDVV